MFFDSLLKRKGTVLKFTENVYKSKSNKIWNQNEPKPVTPLKTRIKNKTM